MNARKDRAPVEHEHEAAIGQPGQQLEKVLDQQDKLECAGPKLEPVTPLL